MTLLPPLTRHSLISRILFFPHGVGVLVETGQDTAVKELVVMSVQEKPHGLSMDWRATKFKQLVIPLAEQARDAEMWLAAARTSPSGPCNGLIHNDYTGTGERVTVTVCWLFRTCPGMGNTRGLTHVR